MHYNFSRIRKSLRVPPAMEAGVSRNVWDIREIVDLLGHSMPACLRAISDQTGRLN